MRAALVLFVAVLGLPSLAVADVVVPIDSVKQFVNIRAETNADSDVIGRLYQGVGTFAPIPVVPRCR